MARSSEDLSSNHLLGWCTALPKVELHAHLNGSIRDSTLKELCNQKLKKDFNFPPQRTLRECFELFDLIHELTDDLYAMERITEEVIRDFAKDNVKYLELRSTPRENAKTHMTKTGYIETTLAVVEKMNKEDLDIVVNLLVSINRAQSKEAAMENIKLAAQYYGKGVAGIDFSGNPTIGRFTDFNDVLQFARKCQLPITLHFAEVNNYKEAMEMLAFKPQRLGHGCFLDDAIISQMKQQRIPLEICLTSNVLSKSCNSILEHHFQKFFKHGYPLCLSTDDVGVFSTSLSQEYYKAATAFNLSQEELWHLSYQAIDYIFATDDIKSKLKFQFSKQKGNLLAK